MTSPLRRHLPFGTPQVSFAVFASPKSGTQWMQQLLSAHPQVQCAESRPFGCGDGPLDADERHVTLERYVSILSRYHRPPEAAGPAGDYFRGLVFDLWDAIARSSLDASGKSIYGEKITPLRGTAPAVVERLAEYDRGLRFVHLSRDGRDVVVSGLVHQQIVRAAEGCGGTLTEAVAATRIPQDLLEAASAVWTEAVSAGLAAREAFRHYLHLRYEDLIEDTARETRRLLQFIGADASAGVVDRCVKAASFEAMSGGRRRGEEDRTSVVRKGVPGDWRRWFTEEQVAWFETRGGMLLERLGHERAAAIAS